MATRIINLDELLPEEKQVTIQGKTYRLPGDLPVELYLRINNAAKQKDLTESETIELLYGELLELFRYGDPKLTRLPLGVGQLVQVIPAIYGAQDDDEGEAERPTTRRTRGASGKTAPKSQRSSRSRS